MPPSSYFLIGASLPSLCSVVKVFPFCFAFLCPKRGHGVIRDESNQPLPFSKQHIISKLKCLFFSFSPKRQQFSKKGKTIGVGRSWLNSSTCHISTLISLVMMTMSSYQKWGKWQKAANLIINSLEEFGEWQRRIIVFLLAHRPSMICNHRERAHTEPVSVSCLIIAKSS